MQFKVPQFIEVEDKVFGPFTLKQFMYMVGGGGLGYLSLKFLPVILGLPLGAAAVTLGLLLAFYKVNDRPFVEVMQAYISFSLSHKLYIWKQKKPEQKTKPDAVPVQKVSANIITQDKIRDLAWSLDVLDQNTKEH